MKKTLKIAIALMTVVMIVCVFAACSKQLSGTYKAEGFVGSTTYEFSGNKVELTAEISGYEKSFEGEYEITTNEEEENVIIFTFEDEDAKSYNGEFAFSEGEEDGVKYIKIAGVKYTKQ